MTVYEGKTGELVKTAGELEAELAECKLQLEEYQKRASTVRQRGGNSSEIDSKFRLAIDTIPVLNWICRPDGSAEFLNWRWYEYTGLGPDEALGWNWANAVHPDDLPGLVDHWLKIIQSVNPDEHEARIRRFDGEYRWFLFRCTPELDSSGAVVWWYGTNTDIEALKCAEEALRVSEQLSRGQFDALKDTMDAMAMEAAPDRLVKHVLTAVTNQLGAHSCSVWRREDPTGLIRFEYSLENGQLVTESDPTIAEINLTFPMEGFWPWTDVFHTGKPGIVDDIREYAPFPFQERLMSYGVVTILIVPMSIAGNVEAVINVRFTQIRTFRPDELQLAQALANQAMLAMLAMQLMHLSAQSRESAVIAERNRIARNIHDTLAQGFTGVIVQLEASDDARSQGLAK
jgi:PAS domain S-box-containing protein